MQSHRRYVVAVLLLLCSSGVAGAVETLSPFRASDDFALTGAQESLIWHAVSRSGGQGTSTSGFNASLYATLPSSIVLRNLPSKVTGQIPMLRPYKYATWGDALLIINPADRKIVDIITP
jgi:hypothetical protein